MRSQARSANPAKNLTSTWLSPTTVASIGFACGVVSPFVAKQGGRWILVGAFLVLGTILCDRAYPVLASAVGSSSRRGLVFVPIAARIVEAGWLWAMWKLGVPAGIVIAAGALSFGHEYLRARSQIAGLRDIAISTLGERSVRAGTVLVGFAVAGLVALSSSAMSTGLVTGVVTFAATAWLLLAVLGFAQLVIVVSAALRR